MWLDGQNAWLGVGTRSWGSKHIAGGWQMCIIEQISEKSRRKKKENIPRAQTMPDMSFGPMGVEMDQNGQLGGRNMWLGVGTRGWGWKDVAGSQNT